MQTTIQNDFQNNYLILQPDTEADMGSYQVRMLLNNDIAPLLPCTIQSVDGQKKFFYDTTDKTPLSGFYEKDKLDYKKLRLLFCRFTEAAEQIGSHLLDVNDLIMAPEYVYVDQQNTQLYFCYLPGFGTDVRSQFRTFTEYLLPKIEHKDQEAVVLGYGIYRQSLEDNFHLDQVKELLYRDSGKASEKVHTYEPDSDCGETARQKAFREFFESEDDDDNPDMREPVPWVTVLSSAGCTVILLGTCVLRYMGYLSFLTLPVMLGIFILLLAMLAAGTYLRKKQNPTDTRMPEKWLQPNVTQASIQWPGKKEPDPDPPASTYAPPPDIGDTQPLPQLHLTPGGTLISNNPQRLADIHLTGDLTLIGKLEGRVDAVIPLSTVSRIHAKLCKVDEEYYIMDLSSKNGTCVNGQRLPERENHRLSPGDEISFADAAYTFAL